MTQKPIISYPIPLYQNLPIEPEWYSPRMFIITAIALGTTTIVTTSVYLDYKIGNQCRLIIPNGYGSTKLNEVSGIVISIPASNQVELDIDSRNVDPFTTAPSMQRNLPFILAIGDLNSGVINTNGNMRVRNTIPGSFHNISPHHR
jgi:hypothetical protein